MLGSPRSLDAFRRGIVVPAHPLALTEDLRIDERFQRALTRYYLDAGAGGLAVGVHTTQFALHTTHAALLEPVLALAAEEAGRSDNAFLVAGVLGDVRQAVAEAELAASLGYDAVLVGPTRDLDESALVDRTRAIGEVLPTIGFYLQPSVGGRVLSRQYWRAIAELPATIGIKVAPFDRYQTIDVLNGVAESGRVDEIALYTGNDDHIASDLLLVHAASGSSPMRFVGGLLGQWAVWTSVAVRHLRLAHAAHEGDSDARTELERAATRLTDANAAIFDVANGFRGCIAGIHEVLRRHGLMGGTWCLDEREALSPGQADEIDRIWRLYPELRDDEFIQSRIDAWVD